jgi:hypothetical protein
MWINSISPVSYAVEEVGRTYRSQYKTENENALNQLRQIKIYESQLKLFMLSLKNPIK